MKRMYKKLLAIMVAVGCILSTGAFAVTESSAPLRVDDG